MKNAILIFFLVFNSGANLFAQSQPSKLSPKDFQLTKNSAQNAQLIDVRTPDEFSNGHIAGAINVDISSKDFQKNILKFDKSKPTFVYCLSGGRSGRASQYLSSEGFTKIYDLEGGMMKWRAANLPETKAENASTKPTITQNDFSKILKSDKTILVDYYAEWCAPCKKMKPYLDEISKEMKNSVSVLRIDADANQAFCKTQKVGALPVLQIYKKGKLTWSHQGFVEKSEVLKHL